jgi:large subunit ribosomal protein L35
MYKLKVKSSCKKRFKINSHGLIMRKHAFKRHILTKKKTTRKKRLSKFTIISKRDKKNIKRQLLL